MTAGPVPAGDGPSGAGTGAGSAWGAPGADRVPERLHLAAQALQRPLTADQVEALCAYLTLLRRWNATYNLTAVRDTEAMVTQHLVDCLAAATALERAGHIGPGGRILDAGSGGGLPGIVFAVLQPGWQVTCVDAVGKKAAFIRQAAGALRLANLSGVHARLGPWRGGPFDLVTARAFASLADLVRWTGPLLAEGGHWMAMKGQVPEREIAELPQEIEVFHVEPLTVPGLEARRCLVWMRRRRDTEPG